MMEKSVSEDERAWFISLTGGNESEERRSSEFSSLGKTQRGFSSLHGELVLEITVLEMLTLTFYLF
jgi:hypothetical protein